MSNYDAYAAGLLNRALDPTTQPTAIREFFRDESDRLQHLVGEGRRVVDFGCGTGRHLAALAPQLALGVGLDLSTGLHSGRSQDQHIRPGSLRRGRRHSSTLFPRV